MPPYLSPSNESQQHKSPRQAGITHPALERGKDKPSVALQRTHARLACSSSPSSLYCIPPDRNYRVKKRPTDRQRRASLDPPSQLSCLRACNGGLCSLACSLDLLRGVLLAWLPSCLSFFLPRGQRGDWDSGISA